MDFYFSVLMSVYIKEIPKYFDRALQSITDDQILKPNQIDLVKDGPLTDELEKIIKKWSKKYKNIFKIIPLEKNMGLGEALRIGIENCSYNLIARMDTDDIAKPERFQEQIKIFKNNEVDLVGSWIDEFWEVDNKIKVQKIRKVPEKDKEIKEKLKFLNSFNHPTVIYKKNEVLKAGSYSEKYHLMEDYYLWVRMAMNGCKFYNIQKSLLFFRTTPDTYKRRGGIRFVKADILFQTELLRSGFVNIFEYLRNLFVRISFRIVPWQIRELLQKKLLRKNK